MMALSEAEELELLELEEAEYQASKAKPPVSQIESGLRGAAQGASLGFADELTGLLESSAGSLGLVPDKTYEQARDESRAAYQAAQEANPLTSLAGNVVGGIGSALLAPGAAATIPGRIAQAAGMGAVTGYGMNENRDNALKDIALGGALGGAAGGIGEALGAGIQKLGQGLGTKAEKLMEKATGATGKQMSEFKPGTGRYLLDSPEISPFMTPQGIANKTGEMLQKTGGQMDEIARSVEGAPINEVDIINNLRLKAAELRKTPEGIGLAKQLESHIDDIAAAGRSSISTAESEATKRGIREGVNYQNPLAKPAEKLVSREYQQATEDAIKNYGDQELLNKFLQSKSEYGMLKPVQKFSQQRANTLNQSPAGGLLDAARAAAGSSMGGPIGGVAASVGGKVLAPIAANVTAHSANFVSKLIKTPPAALGKFAGIIQNAAVRGQSSVAVTDWLLEQSNPEYREMKKRLNP